MYCFVVYHVNVLIGLLSAVRPIVDAYTLLRKFGIIDAMEEGKQVIVHLVLCEILTLLCWVVTKD
ncbi:hypothetical protein DE146DRAFT_655111 [Phaeosphaeria sp. MPI-PUGE-AT-0046c]|nr:hypothetical protein DE146DRAFT_655111 [Phaeosphaeria sp. MPI-PUGE-AT-0046c]